jgi:hypothetical protein
MWQPAQGLATRGMYNECRHRPRPRSRDSVTALSALAFALTLTAAPAAPPAKPGSGKRALPEIRFVVSEIGNLVYQLDCLSGKEPCAFEALWKKRLGWTPEDDDLLVARKRLTGRYKGSVTLGDQGDDGPLLVDYPQRLTSHRKVLRAALEARDIDDYQRRLEMVMLPQDAAEVTRMTARLLPRFRVFFREARPRLDRVAGVFKGYLGRPAIAELLRRAVAFFEVPNPGQQRAEFPLISIPPEWKGRTRGDQFENQAMMEVKADDTPDFVHFSIALHEGFHYLYGTSSAENTRKLVAAFARSADPGAATAYSLINEVLASTLSAGLVQKLFETPQEWQVRLHKPGTYYQITTVDAVARAMVPWLEDRLARGLTLYEDTFVPQYVALARKALGAEIDRPSHARVILAALDEEWMQPALQIISNAARPTREQNGWPLADEDLRGLFEKHPQQGGYVMVRADHLEQLRRWEKVLGVGLVERLAQLSQKHRVFIHGVPRPGVTGKRSMVYVFVGRQTADFERMAKQFLEAPAPFDLLPAESYTDRD